MSMSEGVMRSPQTVAQQIKLLRFLADELEAGRASVDLELSHEREVYAEPRSWHDDPALPPVRRIRDIGSKWTIKATTSEIPEIAP